MLEYRLRQEYVGIYSADDAWSDLRIEHCMGDYNFKYFRYRLNNTEYDTDTDEFKEIWNKQKMWEILNDRM